jgi:hypothetical protein
MLLAAIWFFVTGLIGLIPALGGISPAIHVILDLLAVVIGILLFLDR